MHPVLFRILDFPIGTYGLLLALAFFAGLWLAKRLGSLDGLDGQAIGDLALAVLIAGILGSKLLMIVVDLSRGALQFGDVFSLSTLRAGGAVHGGILAATATFFWYLRKSHLPVAQTGDALAPAVALGQGIGRLGCFAAGCCYGTSCDMAWAVTFTNPDAAAFSGTPLGFHLHPVQIYMLLGNLAVCGALLLIRKRRAFPGQILALYFALEGLHRLAVETWRGDVDRGTWFGLEWLSTGRLTGLAFVLIGMAMGTYFRRRPMETP